MKIFVIHWLQKPLPFYINSTDTVLELKSKIRAEENIWPQFIKLIFRSRFLEDYKTLSDYGIEEESRIIAFKNPFDMEPYCSCDFHALIYLSAQVSLQCGDTSTFDEQQLLHSIKTKLTSLGNGATEIVLDCIQTCGYENKDNDYFPYYLSKATFDFTCTIIRMAKLYLTKISCVRND